MLKVHKICTQNAINYALFSTFAHRLFEQKYAKKCIFMHMHKSIKMLKKPVSKGDKLPIFCP